MKKFLSTVLLFTLLNLNCLAAVEHLRAPEKMKHPSPTDVVYNTGVGSSVLEYNVIEVTFAEDFSTKYAKTGDTVGFLLNNGLQTREGSCILPPGTKILATVQEIDKPKMFNKSGKVLLLFHSVEMPNGQVFPLSAKLFSEKQKLSRGKLNALGKGLGSTLGGAGIGIGAGCGIGVAASAVIIGGFAIGLPVGFALGAIIGLVTPGLQYRAKAGDKLLIQLTDNLEVQR